MEEMDLQSRKITFVQEFLKIQNEDLISSLEIFLKKKKKEFVEAEKPMTIEQLHKDVDLAMEDAGNGYLTKATDLKEKTKKWR